MPTSFVVGLIGSGIQASRTPRMHEWEADALGLRYIYRLIDLDALQLTAADLPVLLRAAQRMGFAGLNVTHPCKQAVVPLLDDLSADARAIGAVNTVVFSGGLRIGHNTDWYGFAEGFRQGLTGAALNHVVQLGAGGAGAAVAHALLSLGTATLSLVDLDTTRAADLARALCARFGSGRAVHARGAADSVMVRLQ